MKIDKERAKVAYLASDEAQRLLVWAREKEMLGYPHDAAALRNEVDACFEAAPRVARLEERILKNIDHVDMRFWHDGCGLLKDTPKRSCGTTHCLAGWSTFLADKGAELEDKFGPGLAGSAIFAKSTGYVPDFHTSTKSAKDALRKRCARRAAAKDRA